MWKNEKQHIDYNLYKIKNRIPKDIKTLIIDP